MVLTSSSRGAADRRQRAVVVVGLAWLGAVMAASPVHAESTIAIEVYERARPADADKYIGPVVDELRAYGVFAGVRTVGEGYEGRQSRPGIAVDPAQVDGLPALIDQGFKAWTEARFEDAAAMLRRAADTAMEASAALVRDSDLRAAFRKALVSQSMAHKRLNQGERASAAMAEFLRSFAEVPLTLQEFGPEAFRLYEQTRSALLEQGTGTLEVIVDDPDVNVFRDEQYTATPERMRNLYAGPYRLLVRKGKSMGRVYMATVEPGKTTVVHVASKLDQVVHTSPGWTGMICPSAAWCRRNLAAYAVRFARVLEAQTIITVGIVRVGSRRWVAGKVFEVGGGVLVRTAAVAIEPIEASENHLRALGGYLAGATNVPPPPEPVAADILAKSSEPSSSGRGRRILLWSALGTGVAAIAVGGYLLAIDEDTCVRDGALCAYYRNTAPGGIALMVGGTVAVGGSAYLLWRGGKGRRPPAHRLSITVGDVKGIALSGEF